MSVGDEDYQKNKGNRIERGPSAGGRNHLCKGPGAALGWRRVGEGERRARGGEGGDGAGMMGGALGASGRTWAFAPKRWELWRAHRRPLATVGSTHTGGKEVLRVEGPRPLHGFRKGVMEAEAGALLLVGSLGCQPGLSAAVQVGHLHHVALLRLVPAPCLRPGTCLGICRRERSEVRAGPP